MFLARIVFFRLHESPRYLVHAGRPQEALESLQMISRFNGSDLSIEIGDVQDHHQPIVESPVDERGPTTPHSEPRKIDTRTRVTSTTIFDASGFENSSAIPSSGSPDKIRPALVTQYGSSGEQTPLDGHTFTSPANISDEEAIETKLTPPISQSSLSGTSSRIPRPPLSPSARHGRRLSTASARRRSSYYEKKFCNSLPRWLRRPLWAWWDRVLMVLSPVWLRTTVLVWAIWWAMSLGKFLSHYVTMRFISRWTTAYTMFNVFLPKLLETSAALVDQTEPKTLEDSLWDVVIFTIGGCPGAIVSDLHTCSHFAGLIFESPAWCIYD